MGRPHMRALACTVPKGPGKQFPLPLLPSVPFSLSQWSCSVLHTSFFPVVCEARKGYHYSSLTCYVAREEKRKQTGKFFLFQESNYLLGEPGPIYISKERDT